MSASDPQSLNEFASIFIDCLVAEGQVPVTLDVANATATVRLFRQWEEYVKSQLGGGGAGSLFATIGIEPGMAGTVGAHLFGPPYSGPAAGDFGATAAGNMQPVLPAGGPFFSLQLPPGAVAAFTIPLAAQAPAGWIDAMTLSPGPGTSYVIDITTNGIGAALPTLVPYVITAGATTLTGVILIAPVVP